MASILLLNFAYGQQTSYSANNANGCALDIYKIFAQANDNNIFFSPVSINLALGMTYAGARGETKQQMSKTLRFPLDDKNFHNQMGALQKELVSKGAKGVEISLANQQWADRNYKFRCRYIREVKKSYKAPAKFMDFKVKPDESRLEINKWVENQTHNRIKDLLPDGSITNLTTLVLTNAIYFKGQWDSQFKEENTSESLFKIAKGKEVKVPMMKTNAKYKVYEGDGIQLLELPYTGKQFSMLVLLPNEGTALSAVEKQLSLETLSHYIDLMTESDVRLGLPKFKLDAEYKLKPVLSEMGMPIAFSNAADLSGMARNKELKIDEVYHKAFVEVSEEGTEAAAATAVVIVRKSVSVPNEFTANRPFMFLIRENQSGSILFMGRVTNPNN